jgi:hypothetical protein
VFLLEYNKVLPTKEEIFLENFDISLEQLILKDEILLYEQVLKARSESTGQ